MRLLLAGVTGQLGHGVVEAAADLGVEVIPVVRSVGGRSARRRVETLWPDRPELAERAVDGDVTQPLWGIGRDAVDALAGQVDGVVNVAAETNWAATMRRFTAVNHMGAMHGLEVARTLWRLDGRCGAYCYAGSIHAAGGLTGSIPEQPFKGGNANRTEYEQSKWLAERSVLDAQLDGPPSIGVARIGGLLGNSRTGDTAKRNSLYRLADDWGGLRGRLFPFAARGRVDMLARDVAGKLLLEFTRGVIRLGSSQPQLVHVCAGEAAPTVESVLSALRSLDRRGTVARPRGLRMPPGPLLWASENLHRVAPLSPRATNTAIGMRYLTFDRVFERSRLARFLTEPPPEPSADSIARLAFELPADAPRPLASHSRLARFAA